MLTCSVQREAAAEEDIQNRAKVSYTLSVLHCLSEGKLFSLDSCLIALESLGGPMNCDARKFLSDLDRRISRSCFFFTVSVQFNFVS